MNVFHNISQGMNLRVFNIDGGNNETDSGGVFRPQSNM